MLHLSLLLHEKFLDAGVLDFPLTLVYRLQIKNQHNQGDDSLKTSEREREVKKSCHHW